jgi:hypothetical protein
MNFQQLFQQMLIRFNSNLMQTKQLYSKPVKREPSIPSNHCQANSMASIQTMVN